MMDGGLGSRVVWWSNTVIGVGQGDLMMGTLSSKVIWDLLVTVLD